MECAECSHLGKSPLGYTNVELEDFRVLHRWVTLTTPHYMRHVRRLRIKTTFYGDETDSEGTPSYESSDAATRRVLRKKGRREPEHRIADTLARLLEFCCNVEWLSLELDIFPHKSIISSFRTLHALRTLELAFCGSRPKNTLGVDLVVSIAMAVPCLRKLTITGLDCACGHKAFPDPFAKERHLKSAFEAQQERYKVSVPNITAYRTLPDVLQIKGLTHLRLRNIYLSDPKWKSAKRECRIHKLDIGCCFPSSYFTNQGAANRIMELFEIELEELTLEALPTQRPVPLGRPRKIPLINLQKLHLDALMPAQDRLHTLYYLSGSPIRKLTISCVKTDIHLVREVLRDFHLRYPRLYPYLKKIIFQVVERKGHVRVVRPPFPICIARQAAGCRSIWKQLDAILAGLHYDSSGAWTLHCPSVRPSYDYEDTRIRVPFEVRSMSPQVAM